MAGLVPAIHAFLENQTPALAGVFVCATLSIVASGHLCFGMFPGRSAARSDALQTRDRYKLRASDDPGSAVHRFALHRIRETARIGIVLVLILHSKG
jgi:hypothetical protein